MTDSFNLGSLDLIWNVMAQEAETRPMNNPNDDATPNGWLINPASNLVLFVGNDTVILAASQRIFCAADLLPGLLNLTKPQLMKANPGVVEAISNLIVQSSNDAEFVKEEIASGFQKIFSHHIVAMWSAIESALEQALINHIRKAPDSKEIILSLSPSLNRPKATTAIAADAEKALALWRSDISNRYEIHSFERDLAMLSAFSYGIMLTADQRHTLVEMSEVRNLLLHRSGFIDGRFLDKTHWTGAALGEQITISDNIMLGYRDAAHAIALAMIGASVSSPYLFKSPSTGTSEH